MLKPFRGVLPQLAGSAFVEESAQLIGDVRIGHDSSVWFNVVIRGDVNPIRIGDRTNIQDGTVVHVTSRKFPTSIGNDVTVGHNAILHGCVVGSGCLIGMGAIVLDGCEIGEGTLIAAGAVLAPGTVIAPGSLVVGAPAHIKRALTEKETQDLLNSAKNYVAYALEYREG
ncbi:MAG: gamma carbonic anhydrase family protein [Desulfuromonadales bacterium GWD2_61_12]|nr:MAG: gamma carbonic anhydrase family protein [Desulfuromonadales bacterium GWC2_61_20]OGR34741.1 MAG: gamma carbonic anhydrase family protein [Desulfuromonadales bacterium GWD2_61_12]HAD04848.1 gamma carbonic anhydrase family protein [Desulfuromonas sp.]